MRLATLILTLGLSTALVGCGFHLRGSQVAALPSELLHVQLDLPEHAYALTRPLTIALTSMGAAVDDGHSTRILKVESYQVQRQPLRGRLSEVRLRLLIRFVLLDQQGQILTEPRQLVTQRSYQYDMATVNTERQEEDFLLQQMNEDIAQQLVRQLHRNRFQATREANIDAAP